MRSAGDLIGLISEQKLFCGWKLRGKLSPEVGGRQARDLVTTALDVGYGLMLMAECSSSMIAGVKGKGAGLASLRL